MSTTLAVLAVVAIVIAMIYVVVAIAKCFFNLLALYDAKHDPDHTKQKYGLVYDETTDKLEADQATILPF
jgi:hypothetical protein